MNVQRPWERGRPEEANEGASERGGRRRRRSEGVEVGREGRRDETRRYVLVKTFDFNIHEICVPFTVHYSAYPHSHVVLLSLFNYMK